MKQFIIKLFDKILENNLMFNLFYALYVLYDLMRTKKSKQKEIEKFKKNSFCIMSKNETL
jgi:hypothetical protein